MPYRAAGVMNACHVCGAPAEERTTEFTLKTAAGPVVVEHVPARVCSQCGTDSLSLETVQRLEAIKRELDAGTRRPDGMMTRPWIEYDASDSLDVESFPPNTGRLQDAEARAAVELASKLKPHLTLTAASFNLITHLVAVTSDAPASETPVALNITTKLMLRLSNDLRGVDFCAMFGYPAQACSLCASAYEVAYAIGYIGDDETRAQEWINHRDPKRYPWSVRTMTLGALTKLCLNDPDAQTTTEYRVYRQLCLAKHANPLFEAIFGLQEHDGTVAMGNGPDTSDESLRPTRFALEHAASGAVIAMASFHKHHLARFLNAEKSAQFTEQINELWKRYRELSDAGTAQYGNEDPFPGLW